MYTVIGTAKSRAARVLWMLEELGQPFEHVAAPPRSEGVTAFNPAGKVPVLIDAGTPITDSTAIIQYLADKHGALTHPAGTLERARQDSLTQFLLDEFDANLWMAARTLAMAKGNDAMFVPDAPVKIARPEVEALIAECVTLAEDDDGLRARYAHLFDKPRPSRREVSLR